MRVRFPSLYQAGAERVFSGEVEVALAFTEAILRTLGATPDQIDQERDRVHRDLFDKPTVAAQQDASSTASAAGKKCRPSVRL